MSSFHIKYISLLWLVCKWPSSTEVINEKTTSELTQERLTVDCLLDPERLERKSNHLQEVVITYIFVSLQTSSTTCIAACLPCWEWLCSSEHASL